MTIGAYTYPRQIPRDTPWFKVEQFDNATHHFRYIWFGRFCVWTKGRLK